MGSRGLLLAYLALILVCLFVGWLLVVSNPIWVFLMLGGLVCFFLTVNNIEIGLGLLIFIIPFTRQFTVGKVGGAPIRLDERIQ